MSAGTSSLEFTSLVSVDIFNFLLDRAPLSREVPLIARVKFFHAWFRVANILAKEAYLVCIAVHGSRRKWVHVHLCSGSWPSLEVFMWLGANVPNPHAQSSAFQASYILRWSVYISVACEPRPLFIQTCGKEICATFIVKYQHGEYQQSNVGLVYLILQSDQYCSHHRCNGTRLRATGINWDQHGSRQLWQMECQGVWSINPDLYRSTYNIYQ